MTALKPRPVPIVYKTLKVVYFYLQALNRFAKNTNNEDLREI